MSIRSTFLTLSRFVIPLALASCAPLEDEEVARSEQPLDGAESSYVSDTVVAALSAYPQMRGRTWNVSHDNRLEGDWVVQTPVQSIWGAPGSDLVVTSACTTNCDADFGRQRCDVQSDCTGGGVCRAVSATVKTPGEAPAKLCTGHSDALYEQIYELMTRGERFVDVTSLTPPDGAFEAAIRNALTFLSKKPNPPQVRLLFAAWPHPMATNTRTVAESLARDIDRSSPIRVFVGAFRSSDLPFSWNHSKIVAIDGKDALVGGHNLWSKHYLEIDPVHDISMRVRGTAAADAQRFANEMWKYTCNNMTWSTWLTYSVWSTRFTRGSFSTGKKDGCPAAFDLTPPAGPSSGTIISVGRLGKGIELDANQAHGNQADVALRALIRSAKRTLRISQQDIGPVKAPVIGIPLNGWPDAEIAELGNALGRGVEVFVVVSNPDSAAGGLSPIEAQYWNGWSLLDIARRIRDYMERTPGLPKGAALRELLCAKLHVARLRYGSDATWPSGVPFANHDKTLAVDEQAFYMGSHNLYPAGLQEFGYIVDDSRATRTYLSAAWSNIWQFSQTTAITGSGVSCQL
jgi:phosphatidylserine/phosphatidylglycerophosphate/cardiolipin synthase-like enzyme